MMTGAVRIAVSMLAVLGVIALFVIPGEGGTPILGMRPYETTRIDDPNGPGGDPAPDGFPKRLFDPSGAEQILPEPPRRIASMNLGADEILCALLDHELDRIAGLTISASDTSISNCYDLAPPGSARFAGAIESVIEVEPDLVITSPGTRAEIVRALVSGDIPVVRFGQWSTLEDLKENIRLIGRSVGKNERAEEIVGWMEGRIRMVAARVAGRPRPRVLFWNSTGHTTGRNTTMGQMIELAGGLNVAAEAGIDRSTPLPTEFALALEPDVILCSTRSVVRTTRGYEPAGSPAREFLDDPRWRNSPAVKNRRVYAIKAGWSTSVSHYAVLALEAMARGIHPEAYTDTDMMSAEDALYTALHPDLVRRPR